MAYLMMNDDLKIANESGFPLQIAMDHQVRTTTDHMVGMSATLSIPGSIDQTIRVAY